MLILGYTLIFNIVGNDGHVGIADSIGIITLGPKISAPQLCLHLFMFGKYVLSGDAFDFLHEI